MSARDDVLAGMTAAQRRRRQLEDARYINDKMQGSIQGSPEAIAVAKSIGSGVLAAPIEQYLPGDPVDKTVVVLCARVDLDHPVYFADNLFASCADCGCDLQYRPNQVPPEAEKMCVCCCARRLREEGS